MTDIGRFLFVFGAICDIVRIIAVGTCMKTFLQCELVIIANYVSDMLFRACRVSFMIVSLIFCAVVHDHVFEKKAATRYTLIVVLVATLAAWFEFTAYVSRSVLTDYPIQDNDDCKARFKGQQEHLKCLNETAPLFKTSNDVTHYFYPLVTQFLLLVAGFLLNAFLNMKKTRREEQEEAEEEKRRRKREQEAEEEERKREREQEAEEEERRREREQEAEEEERRREREQEAEKEERRREREQEAEEEERRRKREPEAEEEEIELHPLGQEPEVEPYLLLPQTFHELRRSLCEPNFSNTFNDIQNMIRRFTENVPIVPGGANGPGVVPGGANGPGVVPGGANGPGVVPGGANGPEVVPGGANDSEVVPGGVNDPVAVPGGANGPGLVPGGANGPGLVPGGANGPGVVPGGANGPGVVPGVANGPEAVPGGAMGGLALVITLVICYLTFGGLTLKDDPKKHEFNMAYNFLAYEIIFLIVIILLCFIGFYTSRNYGSLSRDYDGYEIVLILTTASNALYFVFTVIALSACFDHTHPLPHPAGTADPVPAPNTVWLLLCHTTTNFLETALQTAFLLHASKLSRPEGEGNLYYVILVHLTACNCVIWFIDSIPGFRDVDTFGPVQRYYYGEDLWNVVYHMAIPVAIFYRFSSFLIYLRVTFENWY